jgi:asparagine synthase (glutamine-hydrolysing)
MSSICALWHQSGQPATRALLERMQDAQEMYGPDRRFAWSDERMALGGNLMHLLPEDVFDAQPLWSPDRSFCLVGDVRLDNRAELIRVLGLTAPEMMADSAILLEAWRKWGSACVEHIYGGFAFAVWTPARQELFAARDHVGERPLFFHRGAGFFALASMPKGLLALPGVFRGFDERRVADAMALNHPDWQASYFTGNERLALGHMLLVTPEKFETRAYWHPSDTKPVRYKRDEEYVEALREIFDDAVAVRLRSPRGIGSELSAGLDSSSVTATAALQLAREGKRLTAFTSVPRPDFRGKGFPGRIIDEGPGAGDVAGMYANVDHVKLDNTGADMLDVMRRWTDALDEPVQNMINLIWEDDILRQARDRGIGVMLQGVFGNATFSFESQWALTDLFRRGQWVKLFRTVRSLRGHGDLS